MTKSKSQSHTKPKADIAVVASGLYRMASFSFMSEHDRSKVRMFLSSHDKVGKEVGIALKLVADAIPVTYSQLIQSLKTDNLTALMRANNKRAQKEKRTKDICDEVQFATKMGGTWTWAMSMYTSGELVKAGIALSKYMSREVPKPQFIDRRIGKNLFEAVKYEGI